MTTALLVMVHGSPRAKANDDLYRILDVIRRRRVYDIVEPGFMECNSPTIPESIARCVEQGAQSLIAVPYFLHTGNHVADDLPTLLDQACADYPRVDFSMGKYIGCSSRLTEILAERAGLS